MKNMLKKIHKTSERGQAIIIIAAALVGLVAIVGLMIDGGILLIEYARLKRGIDAASIAAASQFRKGFVVEDLVKAGEEFLKFNQSDAQVSIFTCETDETLCFDPPRKLVRVTATRRVQFGFMRIVGIDYTDIEATSVGEAASVDMVLIIDTSSSMAYDTNDYTPGDNRDNDPADQSNPVSLPGDDPVACNSKLPLGSGRCEPLGSIIDVAVNFVEAQLLFYPYDRVALIASTEQVAGGNRNPVVVLPFNNNYNEGTDTVTTEIQNAIRALRVFQPVACDTFESQNTSLGGCIRSLNGIYDVIGCDRTGGINDTSTCGSSNFGGSFRLAGQQFDYARQEAFWVTIALIGGPATATDSVPGKPNGFCPSSTWPPNGRGCRDADTVSINAGFNPSTFEWDDATRHSPDLTDPANPIFPSDYDADDYARDAADYITDPETGQGATLYSICLGNLCRSQYPDGTADPYDNPYTDRNRTDPWSGDHLGEYIAQHSGGDTANHGLYYYSSDVNELSGIFADIANNIFTRISQ